MFRAVAGKTDSIGGRTKKSFVGYRRTKKPGSVLKKDNPSSQILLKPGKV
jgi:hypothetical protein